ncbi:MAG: acetate--CoA ligase family protein, partial [Acidimicrobiia bacterium]|nr:acetate--CoA ligase family protein [Acidimicrobiia bacterium]
AEAAEVASADEAAATAERLARPVALKAGGLARRGRSEAAGVALDLQGPEEVRAAFERMSRALGERLFPAVVQEMVRPGADLLVAIEQSHVFGPVLALGPGGVSAGATGPPARRVLPLTDLDAAGLVREGPVAPMLVTEEGEVLVDVEAVEAVLLRLARLASDRPELVDLRANPVIASPDGAVVVDVTVRVGPPPRARPPARLR